MKAWQFTNTHEPLVLTEVEEPTPGPGQVLLEMKAAGLCHSDVGLLEDEGWLSMLAKTPITIGHENAGVVAELGEGVTEFSVGDRVGVCPTTEVGAPGHHDDGGFAPQLLVRADTLVPMPDGLDFVHGAAGTDAGMTSHSAVITQGGVKAGDNVGIIGLGVWARSAPASPCWPAPTSTSPRSTRRSGRWRRRSAPRTSRPPSRTSRA
ncbi:alcohol dehydrogenase catalytic domain-containing protein [Micrococcus terreus]|uniref:alcohol dehydrogenase catalytic domain-containing protein n=1 Tax=Micrococcus terreus TaxID=574650 RepID=UPI003D75E1A0